MNLNQYLTELAYPLSWDKNFFKQINSYKSRSEYCRKILRRIKSGSGREVFQIDNDKVLKLARNKKGQAQNQQEKDLWNDFMAPQEIMAKVFDSDEEDEGLWIEMEYCLPASTNDFKQYFKVDFDTFRDTLGYIKQRISPSKFSYDTKSIEKTVENFNEDDHWWYFLFEDFLGNFTDIPVSDLMRKNSWGKTKDGKLVMVDYGLTEDIYQSYYNRKKIQEEWVDSKSILGKTINLFKNPSAKEMSELPDSCRGFINIKNGNLYLVSDPGLIHSEVIKFFKKNSSKTSLADLECEIEKVYKKLNLLLPIEYYKKKIYLGESFSNSEIKRNKDKINGAILKSKGKNPLMNFRVQKITPREIRNEDKWNQRYFIYSRNDWQKESFLEELKECDLILDVRSSKILNESQKRKILDILKVKSKSKKNSNTKGIPSNFFEENFIKKYYPKFYKERVRKKKRSKFDKLGLPKNPFVWLPRSA